MRMSRKSKTCPDCGLSRPEPYRLATFRPRLFYRLSMNRFLAPIFIAFLLCCVAPVAQARDLVVFAAASLKNVLDDAAYAFETERGTPVAISYSGSAALARQIQQGAPADIYISANMEWMDLLEEDALIRPASRAVLAGNRLVLIGEAPGELPLTEDSLRSALAGNERLAMGQVSAVPAGIYGKAALDAMNLWGLVSASIVQTDNVRAALRLVALGEAQLGIVYATDAGVDAGAHILAEFPSETHPPILYPAAITADSIHADANEFMAFLRSGEGQQIFAAHGFLPGQAP